MSTLTIKAKADLSPQEAEVIRERLAAPEHLGEKGPITCWNHFQQFLYAFFLDSDFVGLAEASGRPEVVPGWWIDSRFRGKGHGSSLVRLLAKRVKAEGATAVGPIPIDGNDHQASARLARRFRAYFPFWLPEVPGAELEERYSHADGNELESGKLASPESSAALVANAFGWFTRERARLLPPLPDLEPFAVGSVEVEANIRFPWRGGKHPWLDAVITGERILVGVESKRYEPFRAKKPPALSTAYWRPVWGDRMAGYQRIRDALGEGGKPLYEHVDAEQLVRHALALRTEGRRRGVATVLYYAYSEPGSWPDGRTIAPSALERQAREVAEFAEAVRSDEVRFVASSWVEILKSWMASDDPRVRAHAQRVQGHYEI